MIAAINAAERDRGEEETRLLGFLHSDPELHGQKFHDYPVIGGYDAVPQLAKQGARFVSLVTGSTEARYETAAGIVRNGGQLGKFIHPTVDQEWADVGDGAYIQEGVLIQNKARIGVNCSIHMGALIAHEVTIGCSCFIAHAVSTSGEITIGDGVFVGTNATILPRLTVGDWATIGAGAVVTKDVPDHAVVTGNPARVIRISDKKYSHADPTAPLDQDRF